MSEGTLVVAFDGMDKELIEKFELENIPQEEFGRIDNDTGISERMTSELYASFITGKISDQHGVEGLYRYEKPEKARLLEKILPEYKADSVRGLRTVRDIFEAVIKPGKKKKPTKEDLMTETLFEELDAALPLYVPSYNPKTSFQYGHPHNVLHHFSESRFVEETRYDTEVRLFKGTATQPALFDVNKEFWDFVMIQLHDPDAFQDTGIGNLEEEYKRLDELAGKILDEFQGWTVIFMSDHGRPEKNKDGSLVEHNRQAFYSCNTELFPGRTPHITSFKQRILELMDQGAEPDVREKFKDIGERVPEVVQE